MNDLSEKVLALTINYLGPASKAFLQRQVKYHLTGATFETLEPKDLPELAKWVFISASLIIDQDKAKTLSDQIIGLKV